MNLYSYKVNCLPFIIIFHVNSLGLFKFHCPVLLPEYFLFREFPIIQAVSTVDMADLGYPADIPDSSYYKSAYPKSKNQTRNGLGLVVQGRPMHAGTCPCDVLASRLV